jgi:pimeloyl-ACP methyl ester carboxylesterase
VIYFSGFCLKNEKELFNEYVIDSSTSVAGFSYGAQQAFEYVYNSIQRVDRLILLSPAFFQKEKKSFIRTQLHYFESGKHTYMDNFLSNVAYPSCVSLSSYVKIGTQVELNRLLTYKWDRDKIQKVLDRGTEIEIFFGTKDKIINVDEAIKFFSMTTNYRLKDAGHLLQG